MLFVPDDSVGRLAALVSRPRINLARYHCVFNSMPIDEYHGLVHSEFPDRPIRFHEFDFSTARLFPAAMVTFIGRCGLYAYLDMHQAVSSSLAVTCRILTDEEYGTSE